jgi:hypothetical protein
MTISVSTLFQSLKKTDRQAQFVDATAVDATETVKDASAQAQDAQAGTPKEHTCCGGCGG